MLDDKATNLIFYTGKEPLPDSIENYNLLHDAHIQIVKSRPNIKRLIPNIVNYFENPISDYVKFKKSSANFSLNMARGIHTKDTMERERSSKSIFTIEASTSDCGYCSNEDVEGTTKTCGSMVTFVLVNSHHAQKNISIHELETIKEKKNYTVEIDLSPNVPEECKSKIGRKGLENDEASSIGHQWLKAWEENTDARDYVENHFPKTRRDTWGL